MRGSARPYILELSWKTAIKVDSEENRVRSETFIAPFPKKGSARRCIGGEAGLNDYL